MAFHSGCSASIFFSEESSDSVKIASRQAACRYRSTLYDFPRPLEASPYSVSNVSGVFFEVSISWLTALTEAKDDYEPCVTFL